MSGLLFLGAVHSMSFFPPAAHALEGGGAARRSRALAPAPCWEAPTSLRLMKGSTQCMGIAATC